MKRNLLILGSSWLILLSSLWSETINNVRIEANSDLQNAIKELADLRSSIENEKLPLARKVTKLEDKASNLRAKLEHYLRLRDNREASLLQLEREVKESEAELDFSLNLLNDYISSWFHGNPAAEKTLWAKNLSEILQNTDFSISEASAFASSFEAISLTIEAIYKSAGGIRFLGNAIIPAEGTREEGTFWTIGPTLLFSGIDGTAGFLEKDLIGNENQKLSLSPTSILKAEPVRVSKISSDQSKIIMGAMNNNNSVGTLVDVPLDPTLGKALIMEKGEVNTFEELKKGGIWIYPIMFFALLSLMIALYKAAQITMIKLPQSAASLDKEFKGPFEQLRKTAKGYQGNSSEILEEILYESIIDIQVKLEKALPLIAVTAATAPLLGLLGTVTGMIDVFRQITNFANPENSELARGISEALVTTKFGLVTAIPSLIAHALLTRRLQGIISKMEGFSARLVRIKKESLEPPGIESNESAS